MTRRRARPRPSVKASIALEWKLPHRPAEVIPQRNLSPDESPETFVVATPFPPDDRSVGYERGTSVSKAWDQATTDAAIEVAGFVATHLRELSGVPDDAPDREPRLRAFCLKFAERAFRRPLADEQKQRYIDRQFEEARDPEAAVKRVVLLVLKSPRFLYREIGGGTDPYDVASRISFGLWDSLPDPELLQAAASGQLATPEQVARQADRMLADLRSRSKLREFFLRWLKVDQVRDLAKDPSQFPEFDEVIASDLRTSLDLFLEDVLWGEASDFRQLLLADSLYLNGRLARIYGVDLPPDAPFQKVTPEPGKRAGVLSHPYLMASFAYTATSSPIHRGVFLARSVLGRTLRPPPDAFTPLAPDLHPDLTTRDRVALQTSPESCLSCHSMINPLGFALENFDAVGRHRAEEKGKPVDATGSYQSPYGRVGGVRRGPRPRDLPGRQRGDARRLRPATLPGARQAADPRLRAREAARPPEILRGERFPHPQARGGNRGGVRPGGTENDTITTGDAVARDAPIPNPTARVRFVGPYQGETTWPIEALDASSSATWGSGRRPSRSS